VLKFFVRLSLKIVGVDLALFSEKVENHYHWSMLLRSARHV